MAAAEPMVGLSPLDPSLTVEILLEFKSLTVNRQTDTYALTSVKENVENRNKLFKSE